MVHVSRCKSVPIWKSVPFSPFCHVCRFCWQLHDRQSAYFSGVLSLLFAVFVGNSTLDDRRSTPHFLVDAIKKQKDRLHLEFCWVRGYCGELNKSWASPFPSTRRPLAEFSIGWLLIGFSPGCHCCVLLLSVGDCRVRPQSAAHRCLIRLPLAHAWLGNEKEPLSKICTEKAISNR